MTKKILIAVLIIIVVLLALMYFKQIKSTINRTTGKTPVTADIIISNFSFSPPSFTAKPGQKVSVTNSDLTQHSLASDDGLFGTGILSPNQDGSFTAPSKPSIYKFHCSIHTTMTGTLTVQ